MCQTGVRRAILSLFILSIALLALGGSIVVAQDQLIIVPITERDGSGVFGDASLIDNGDGTTTVDILVSGASGGHPVFLHSGTCNALGDVIVDLGEIDDEGTSVTNVSMPLDSLLDQGPRAVNIQRSSSESSTSIGCGAFGDGDPLDGAETELTATPTAGEPDSEPESPTCTDFDAWTWAQTVYLQDIERNGPALDADDNGIACEQLPIGGFAPALWTDTIPDSAEPVQVTGVFDGDTFQVVVDGQFDIVRMHHIDAPDPEDCGYLSASNYLAFVLSLAPGGVVYLEYDGPQRDGENRRLAYVWYEFAGDPYLVNEVMVRGGWAASEPSGEGNEYRTELREAETFSVDHVLGVRLECGRFDQPPGSGPSEQQLQQAMERQPNQGQFGVAVGQ